MQKTYWAFVAGQVEPERGTWTDAIRKVPDEPRAEIVDQQHPQGRLAVLHYRVLSRSETGSWLEVELETGRTHQIRVQAAARGYPVLGDHQYGSQHDFGPATDDVRQRWIALHGRRLALRHPRTREPVSVIAPLPHWWDKLDLPAVDGIQ